MSDPATSSVYMSGFVAPASGAVISTNGTSAIFGPIPISKSRKVSMTK